MTKCPAVRHRLSLLPVMVAALFLGALLMPEVAQARSYDIVDVSIDATVGEDGSLLVSETRTFEFDGSFNGVYWEIPIGYNESNGKDVEVSVLRATVASSGSSEELDVSDAGTDGTYRVSETDEDTLRLTIYSAHKDETVSFTIEYIATGIVTRWSDTGEIYWKFVSDGWDVMSENVTCTLHLPVPEGESVVAEENVRAWGHGPLDATVSFSGNDIVFDVPAVGTSEYAEMRVTFPAEWVAALEETSGEALSAILSEEQAWADEANAQRMRARILYGGVFAMAAVVCVATLVVTLRAWGRYRCDFRPRFSDTYFRDVPTDDHPAVLGALYNDGSVGTKELTATLMHLTDKGVIRLDRVRIRRRGLVREKVEEDYRLTKVADVSDEGGASARIVDERLLDLVFGNMGTDGDEGAPELFFSQIERYAKKHPKRYSDAYDSWMGAVKGQYLLRFSGGGLKGYGRGLVLGLGILCFVVAATLPFVLVLMGAHLVVAGVMFFALLVAGIISCVVRSMMKDVNHEAVEAKARLKALERWLREFTRLDEAVPTDVVLWNRLLVMAVVLGVADEVIEQLKVAVPEMLDDPCLMPTYGWLFWRADGMRPPVAALSKSLNSAHMSVAALSESRLSSGGGGGGGFSGGGGGGFGGGGGGGAF